MRFDTRPAACGASLRVETRIRTIPQWMPACGVSPTCLFTATNVYECEREAGHVGDHAAQNPTCIDGELRMKWHPGQHLIRIGGAKELL